MKKIDIDALMGRIRADLMTDKEVCLLKMTLSGHPAQKEFEDLIADWDFDVEGPSKSLLISYLTVEHPELVLSDAASIHLKPVLNYFHFHNIKLIAQFKHIISGLADNGISVIIFKGGAMKHLRPNLPRRMSDIDVLVDEKDYRTAGKLIEKMGYDVSWDEHSFDVHEPGITAGILDVHKFIPMLTGQESQAMAGIMGRAKDAVLFGTDGRILCEEDLVFSLLVNLARNIANDTSTSGMLFTFVDLNYLCKSKEDFDWNIIATNAEKSGSEALVVFALRFINSVIPGMLPETISATEEQMRDIAATIKYRRYLLCPLQERSHKLDIGTVLKSPHLIPDFITVRPRYTFLKLFRKQPKLSRIILSVKDE